MMIISLCSCASVRCVLRAGLLQAQLGDECLATECHSGDSFTTSLLFTAAHTYTHPFNGPLSETTRVSRYQKGKTSLDFTGARDNEWQWHQLGHMQVCTSLQTDYHTSTPPLCFTGQMPFLPPNQQRQSTEVPFHCSNMSNNY